MITDTSALNNFEGSQTNSLNSLSPYIGRLRSQCARHLISEYAVEGQRIYDPFCGSGTVLLEGWANGFNVIGNDLNKYAHLLSLGKTHPYPSENLALNSLNVYNEVVTERLNEVKLPQIPEWVEEFYHPETLKEILVWVSILSKNNEWFLLSCLMGILHHQRPGFLSYPASHGTPYLRKSKYPQEIYPEMYEYRDVFSRLSAKVKRSYKNIPSLDYSLDREVYCSDAVDIDLKYKRIATIITSPPYMKALTYGRDNRLRLWFLGVNNWKDLDKKISPSKNNFISMMSTCVNKWSSFQKKGDKCIIVIGDVTIEYQQRPIELADLILQMAEKKYNLYDKYYDPIPSSKKQIKANTSIKRETIIVLERR
ncbi:MAG: hypothetical protein IJA20_05145 [Methanocorpusculum sp.]|nr:hypothetical protein [Methanocorpusculum sp.]